MARYADKVQAATPDACWIWTGPMRGDYGVIQNEGAHRVFYEFVHGPIPEGLVLHHECQETRCVNPGHLRPMTQSQHSSGHLAARRIVRNAWLSALYGD